MNPQRVQRTRRKGKPGIPESAIYVGRGSRWGNPYKIFIEQGRVTVVHVDKWGEVTGERWGGFTDRNDAAVFAVDLYRRMLLAAFDRDRYARRRYLGDLVGHDLACWCPVGQPCHADVLLELANDGGSLW